MLPIEEILPRLGDVLAGGRCAVLVAPPGAGKTTRVPLFLKDQDWAADGKLIVLEPRRLAARRPPAGAERHARRDGGAGARTGGLQAAQRGPDAVQHRRETFGSA
jgi:ATP-dependent helicase HrpB